MSLTSPIPDPGSGIAITAVGHSCFYCGRDLQDPAVVWVGEARDEIYLHPDCVIELTLRLFRDLLELRHG